MQSLSKFLTRKSSCLVQSFSSLKSMRAFSVQSDMEVFDFSEKLNVQELNLKNPNQL